MSKTYEMKTARCFICTLKKYKNSRRIQKSLLTHRLPVWEERLTFFMLFKFLLCVCWASLVAQLVKNWSAVQETRVQSLGRKDTLEKEMATHPVSLPGKSHGQRSLVGCSPWGHKELGTTERLTLTN